MFSTIPPPPRLTIYFSSPFNSPSHHSRELNHLDKEPIPFLPFWGINWNPDTQLVNVIFRAASFNLESLLHIPLTNEHRYRIAEEVTYQ